METLISKTAVDPQRSLIPIDLVSGYVLVEHIPVKRTVVDGVAAKEIEGSKVLLAASIEEQFSKGVIMSIGRDVESVKPGMTVTYFRQQAKDKEFDVDGKLYDLINAVDLIGII